MDPTGLSVIGANVFTYVGGSIRGAVTDVNGKFMIKPLPAGTYTLTITSIGFDTLKIEGIKVAKPNGAFYCIAELPIKNSDDFAQWLLEDFDVDGETIMVAPAGGFYSTPGVGLNQIRIAYVLKKESLIKAVNILKQALKVYKD